MLTFEDRESLEVTIRGTSKMLVIFFLKLGVGFMGVLTLLNLIELFACDSCTFLHVGFTSIKNFLKTTEDESRGFGS